MSDENPSERAAAESRRFLKKLLADCERADLPGSESLIQQIRTKLASLPALADDPPNERPPGAASGGLGQ